MKLSGPRRISIHPSEFETSEFEVWSKRIVVFLLFLMKGWS